MANRTAATADGERLRSLAVEDITERTTIEKRLSEERARFAAASRRDPIRYVGRIADKIENPAMGVVALHEGTAKIEAATAAAERYARELDVRLRNRERYIDLTYAALEARATEGVTQAIAEGEEKAKQAILAAPGKVWEAAGTTWRVSVAIPAFVGASWKTARLAKEVRG